MSGLGARSRFPPAPRAAFALLAAACTSSPLDAIELEPTTLETASSRTGPSTREPDRSPSITGNRHDAQITGGAWVSTAVRKRAPRGRGHFATVDNFPYATSTGSVAAWVRLTDESPRPRPTRR